MLMRLREQDPIDWSRASIDGILDAKPLERLGSSSLYDRGELGSKQYIAVNDRGSPVVILASCATDMTP
ncbi:unnamed protein product [Allacma fusca]|uniref:Uncharacterized protein n=1 Tax=Allacma fusca TaxID=39272 RepID=A0A8J2P4S6_9HEXA|nr:unnamed protein product [Allacma fusca]